MEPFCSMHLGLMCQGSNMGGLWAQPPYKPVKLESTKEEKKKKEENKMAEEQVDVEYIFLHGYIRNTPSGTEVHAGHQLRVDRST